MQKQFSQGKDAELVVTQDAATPSAIKSALLSAAEGSIVGPIETDQGFYVFKVASKRTRALDEVQSTVYSEIQQQRLQESIREIRDGVTVTVK